MKYIKLKTVFACIVVATIPQVQINAKEVSQTVPYNLSEISDFVKSKEELKTKDSIEISFKDNITGQNRTVSVKPDKVEIVEASREIFYDTKYGYTDYFANNMLAYRDGNKEFVGSLLSKAPAYPSTKFTDGTWFWSNYYTATSVEWEGPVELGCFKDNKNNFFTWRRKVRITYKEPIPVTKYEIRYSGSYVHSSTVPDEKPKVVTTASAPSPTPSQTLQQQSNIQTSLVNYLSKESNAAAVMKRALVLNSGVQENTCVYFLSEAFRKVGLPVPLFTANTTQLTNYLTGLGWQKYNDYKQLRTGDICFTTDINLGKGSPTHAFTFVAWVTPGNYDFAYIVDNQAYKYSGKHNHTRNIAKVDLHAGDTKEPFSYFLRK